MSNVVRLEPVEVGPGYRFDPDELLEAAKGHEFATLVIIGELPNGETWVSGSASVGEALVMIERGKHQLVFGEG
ncbi:hypothetical protein [Mesorhizobium sp.]|uniref:hypothetical protein n=1 Tax=Mesorhizobium sp. TaxID=1871066 RepID=UPI000FE2CE18|nr:hypothetical protein [Mesorhizobium sp.]RWK39245.1 MAG: phosphoribosylformylglycinamidine synthase [Mesorhizobium sp.]